MDGAPTSVVSSAALVSSAAAEVVAVEVEVTSATVVSSTLVEVEAGASSSAEEEAGASPPASLPGAQMAPETWRVLVISAPSQAERTHGVAAAVTFLLLAGSQEQAMSVTEQSVSEAMAFWRHSSCWLLVAAQSIRSREVVRTYGAGWEISAGDLGGGTGSEGSGNEDGRVLHFDGFVGFINYLSDKRM